MAQPVVELCCDAFLYPTAVNAAVCEGRTPAPWTCVFPLYGCNDPLADNYHTIFRGGSRARALQQATLTAVASPPPPAPPVGIISDPTMCQYGGCTDPSATNHNPRCAGPFACKPRKILRARRPPRPPRHCTLMLPRAAPSPAPQRHVQRRHVPIFARRVH